MPASLSRSRRLRLFAFTSFYVAQGLPLGLITVAFPAWLAANGAGGDVPRFIFITTLPWGFKLLAGPLMDRFRFPSLGGRRPWVMLAQSSLLLSLVGLAISGATSSDIDFLIWCCFVINSFAAIQDVAVDGMAIDVLPESERGRANALMGFGQVAGLSGSAALCGLTLAAFGVAVTASILAVGIGIILSIVVLLRERDGEKMLPWTAGSVQHEEHLRTTGWWRIITNLFNALILPGSLLLLLVTLFFRLADGMFITATPLILAQDFGWESSEVSNWIAYANFFAAVSCILLGPLIDRRGARAFFLIGLAGTSLAYLALGLTAPWWQHDIVWIAGLFVVKFVFQITFVSFIALHMTICWSKIAATQFAVYMAWANFSRSFGASAYGGLAPRLDIGQEMFVMAGLCVVSGAILITVNLARHRERIDRLRAREPAADAIVDLPARY